MAKIIYVTEYKSNFRIQLNLSIFATKGETMAQSSFGGVVGGSLEQFTTTDSYEEVVDFYTEALTN